MPPTGTARPTTPRTDEPPPHEGRRVLVRIVSLAIAVRVGLEVIGLVSTWADAGSPVGNALGLWSAWDAPHYLRLAEVGYRAVGEDALFIVFLPLYPAAVALVGTLVRDVVVSGLVVSLAASVGAGWFLYRLVRLDASGEEAWRAVVLLFLFPTGYFLAAPYSESLFLLGLTASVYAARSGLWGRAGPAGAIATGTRLAGLALLPALAFEALRSPTWRLRIRRLASASLAGVGFVVYLLINQVVFDDPLHFLATQRSHWHQGAVPPWRSLVDAVRGLAEGATGDFVLIFWGRLGAFAFAAALLAVGWRRLDPVDRLYGWSALLLVTSASWLLSLPRYLLGIYPLFIVGARLTRRRGVFLATAAVSAAGQGIFFWRYAQGLWTF